MEHHHSIGRPLPCQPAADVRAEGGSAAFSLDFARDVIEPPTGPKVFEVSAFGGFVAATPTASCRELYVNYVFRPYARPRFVEWPTLCRTEIRTVDLQFGDCRICVRGQPPLLSKLA